MSSQLRLDPYPEQCARPYPCECHRCRPLTSRRTGSIQERILALLEDGRQRTAAAIALTLSEGADTVARELRKLRARPEGERLYCVTIPGKRRAVWFLVQS